MAKIWDKNNKEQSVAQQLFNEFTTGKDYILDKENFIYYDLRASQAHAYALHIAGVYTLAEFRKITNILQDVIDNPGKIEVTKDDEDCHTAIERYLVLVAGDLGKKIHTGRSRNDQSLTMIRLYMKENMKFNIMPSVSKIVNDFKSLSIEYTNQLFIGYSHTQQAMLTTLGHYFDAFKEQLEDDYNFLEYVVKHIDKNPLGSGAGFGSPIYLDRNATARLMGFKEVQVNSLYCQNSRGKFELLYLHGLSQVMQTLQRFATDMLLYTTREFSFFNVSDELSQGSSMMPQKKNLDVFEIIRAKSAEIISIENRVQLIMKGLPSGYNRDLQIIKNALVESTDSVAECLKIFNLTLNFIQPNDYNIRNAIKKDIYSADAATLKCMKDTSLNFRDVYKQILDEDLYFTPEDIIKSRVSLGAPGNY
jgi:argininosuccinate lyase